MQRNKLLTIIFIMVAFTATSAWSQYYANSYQDQTNIVGTVVGHFQGEIDPYVVGDVCILFLQTQDNSMVGIVEDMDRCSYTNYYAPHRGVQISIPRSYLRYIRNYSALSVLQQYDSRVYYLNLSANFSYNYY